MRTQTIRRTEFCLGKSQTIDNEEGTDTHRIPLVQTYLLLKDLALSAISFPNEPCLNVRDSTPVASP